MNQVAVIKSKYLKLKLSAVQWNAAKKYKQNETSE